MGVLIEIVGQYCRKFFSINTKKTTPIKFGATQIWCTVLTAFTILQSMQQGVSAMSIQQSSKMLHQNAEENSILKWENPCGGKYIGDDGSSTSDSNSIEKNHLHTLISNSINSAEKRAEYKRAIYKILRRNIRINKDNLKQDKSIESIDTSDIKTWSLHDKTYKFLAQIKPDENINLTRWHANVQVYVASIDFLRRKQEEVDRRFTHQKASISKELNTLLQSARSLLCEIETTINATSKKPIKTISTEEMTQILTLRTTNSLKIDETEVDQIDLMFVKNRFNQFLAGSAKTLTNWLNNKKSLENVSEKNSSKSENRRGGHHVTNRRKRWQNTKHSRLVADSI